MSIYNRYDILTEFAKKKKSNVRTCLNGAKDATGASQTFDAAKVQINSEITKQKLENLKEKYKNTTNPYGFLTDLQIAMGLPRVKRASNYGIVTIPKSDGSATVSIRISNHSTNAGTYITNNANQEYNLSIVVRKRARKKTFIPHDDVRLDEYIYYGNRLRNVESPLVQIINSIIGFLDSGMYVDTTGVALHNTSPQQLTNENKQTTNISKNMKKQTIKLNESQLRDIIKESVKKMLYERKPADRQVGPHLFKGVKYDTNGNPNYTCDTVPDDWKKTMRWKMSQKHGLHGQLGDPSKVPGVISEEYNSDAFSLMDKVRKCVMLNLASEIGGNHHEITRGENNSILVINRDNPSEGVKVSFDFYNADI